MFLPPVHTYEIVAHGYPVIKPVHFVFPR